MDEYLDILNEAWTKEKFSFKGRFYSCENLSVTPKPVQRPIPIWFGASGKAGLRRAAKRGLPLIGSNRHTVKELKEQYGIYRNYLNKFGKIVTEVPILRQAYIAESYEKAVQDSRASHMNILGGMYGKWAKWRTMLDDKGRSPDDPAFFEFESHKEKVILGTPKDAISQIENYGTELGVNNMLLWMAMPGMPHDKVVSSITLFGRDVIPSFS